MIKQIRIDENFRAHDEPEPETGFVPAIPDFKVPPLFRCGVRLKTATRAEPTKNHALPVKPGLNVGQDKMTQIEKNEVKGLIPPNALTLQELKSRQDNSPVFVKCIAPEQYGDTPVQGWGLIRTSLVRLWHKCDLAVFDYHFEDYGITWLAFNLCVDRTLIRDWTK